MKQVRQGQGVFVNILPLLFGLFLITALYEVIASLLSKKQDLPEHIKKPRLSTALVKGWFGGILFAFVLTSNQNNTDSGVIWLIFSPTAFYVYKWFKRNKEIENDLLARKIAEEWQAQENSDCFFLVHANALRILLKHLKTIIMKHDQNLYVDDYGEIRTDAIKKEIGYFFDQVLTPNLLKTLLPSNISRDIYIQFVEMHTNPQDPELFVYAELEDLIYKFAVVYSDEEWEDALWSIICKQAAYISAAQKSSDEVLQYIIGDNHHAIQQSIIMNSNNQTLYNNTIAESVLDSLIDKTDLQKLREWLLSRNNHSDELDEAITGQDFELLCQRRLQSLGWQVKTTVITGDFGADLVAERNGITVVIQCKHYSQPVGVKAVQEAFSAMKFYSAKQSAVIASNSFTKAAMQLASKNKVMLLHVDDLEKL